MLRQARTFNLIFYLLLAVLAVALAPAAVRGLLACIALLPMPLQLAAVSRPMRRCWAWCSATRRSACGCAPKSCVVGKILLIALGGAVGPAKAIYLPVVLLCFIIPVDNLVGRRNLSGARLVRACAPGS